MNKIIIILIVVLIGVQSWTLKTQQQILEVVTPQTEIEFGFENETKDNCDYLSEQAELHFSLSKILEEGGRVVSVKVAPNNAKVTNNIKESVLEMGFFQHLEVAKTYLDIYAHVCN